MCEHKNFDKRTRPLNHSSKLKFRKSLSVESLLNIWGALQENWSLQKSKL